MASGVPDAGPAAKSDSSVPRKTGGRRKLVRPRGKRGGIKNRKGAHAKKIALYHTLEKQIARTSDATERKKLLAQQEQLGGLAAYQDQSTTGSDKLRGGESAKWCVKVLRELVDPQASANTGAKDKTKATTKAATKLSVLDVGAIAGTSYAKWKSWIDATYIDLNPRAPHVHQSDFFSWPTDNAYNLVGLSLVINFVGDLRQRGNMLLHAHNYLVPGGYVYLVLPLACVTNSRYLTHEHLREILDAAGYNIVRQEDSKKLTRWLLQQKATLPKRPADPARPHWDGRVFKKKELIAEKLISEHLVAVFSKSYCPYCRRAKDLIQALNIESSKVGIIELDKDSNGPAIQNYLLEKTGQRTVPNIFINGKHLGGSDDLSNAQSTGELSKLLASL
ncbi:25S rRNA (adenine(2142)-N(1))-methyltransferase [Malassezia cuniculi]|uniref:glutathione peroxidase n=1 Tax=Malassezia cuniculi TaxID=948313 RepID=A0AAF0ETD5_9BASI|nr:25S rRNA (adenine(2142)-N(1))-methyltransferase [Malassezia cuniculi]